MKARNAGIYFVGSMLFLFFAAIGIFIVWMPWPDCSPMSTFDSVNYPNVSIPVDAECFYINHGVPNFLSWAGQLRRTAIFLAIDAVALLAVCIALTQYQKARSSK